METIKVKYKVGVYCMTFNQAMYITDAMNGFCMQQTSFPFVCCIVDDASTDGEQGVINKYVEENFDFSENSMGYKKETDYAYLTFAQHKTNKNCYFAVLLLKENLYSKKQGYKKLQYISEWVSCADYIALCEGDDYWTDSLKLQKQMDFMEINPHYSMCFHNAIEHWEKKEKEDALFSQVEDRDYQGVEIYKDWIVPTASVLIRADVMRTQIYEEAILNTKFIYGDIITFLSCASYGKIRGMSDCMSVYRKHEGGVTFIMTTKKAIAHAYHNLYIYKVFGESYKDISIKYFMDTILYAYLMTRAEGVSDNKLLFDAFKVQPKRTLSFILKRIIQHHKKQIKE